MERYVRFLYFRGCDGVMKTDGRVLGLLLMVLVVVSLLPFAERAAADTTMWVDYFDDTSHISSSTNITVSSGDATLTDVSTELLRPVGAGSATSEGAVKYQTPDDAGAHWEKVDEATADDATTMVYQAFSSEDQIWRGDLFTTQDHSVGSGTISSVEIHFRVRRSVTSGLDAWARPVIKTHNTQYNGTTVTITPFNTWTNYSQTWTTNPNTGDPWTWEEIDALQTGVGLKMDYVGFPFFSASRAECTQVYAEVEYTHTGEVISESISPSSLENWDTFAWDDTEPTNTDIAYQVEYYDGGGWSLIPDGDLSGNSSGFDTSPVNLLSLNTSTYAQLRLKANFSSSEASVTPTLHEWHLTWNGWSDGEITWDKIASSSNVVVNGGTITLPQISDPAYISPTSNVSTGIPKTNGSGAHYQLVDDSPTGSDDGNSTEVWTDAWSFSTDRYGHSYSSDPGGVITGVTLHASCRTTLGSGNYGKFELWLGGSQYSHTFNIAYSGVSDYPEYEYDFIGDIGSVSWEDIQDCDIGISLDAAFGVLVGCSRLYLKVDYEAYESSGNITSTAITPGNLGSWDTFTANHALPAGTDVTYKVLDASDDSVLCTITSAQASSGYDISSCAGSTSSVKAYAELTSNGDYTPSIQDILITWSPPNATPTVSAPVVWDTEETPAMVSAMTPQVEYNVKVGVTDNDNLSDLSTVKVTIFYDSDGAYSSEDVPSTGNTQTAAILTWTNGGSPAWTINPGSNTSWTIESDNCVAPTLTNTTGTFEFHFKPGKVATENTGSAKWHIYAEADDGIATGDNYSANNDMNWYGEVTDITSTTSFGTVGLGSEATISGTVSVTCISNGAYDEQVKSGTWSGQTSGTTLDLHTSDTNPGTGQFSLKADDDATQAGSVQVLSASYVTIDDTGTQTGESGDTVSTNHCWLWLGGLGIPDEEYQGIIYFQIADGS